MGDGGDMSPQQFKTKILGGQNINCPPQYFIKVLHFLPFLTLLSKKISPRYARHHVLLCFKPFFHKIRKIFFPPPEVASSFVEIFRGVFSSSGAGGPCGFAPTPSCRPHWLDVDVFEPRRPRIHRGGSSSLRSMNFPAVSWRLEFFTGDEVPIRPPTVCSSEPYYGTRPA